MLEVNIFKRVVCETSACLIKSTIIKLTLNLLSSCAAKVKVMRNIKLLTTTKQESFHSSYSHRLHDQTKLSARHQEKRLCVGAMFITNASAWQPKKHPNLTVSRRINPLYQLLVIKMATLIISVPENVHPTLIKLDFVSEQLLRWTNFQNWNNFQVL